MNAIVRDASTAARDAYSTPLRLQLQADLPPVFGDPLALRRILDNLVANAAQSLTAADGAITISTASDDRVVRMLVADTGRGMTQDELTRALAGFYSTKPHGTGLGLSVVRRLVADHGGAVHVDTAPRRGTIVIIELPTHPMPIAQSVAIRS